MRTLQVEVKPATSMKRKSSMSCSRPSPQTKSAKMGSDRRSDRPTKPVVTAMASLSPIWRCSRPAMAAANRGPRTISGPITFRASGENCTPSAPHLVDVFHSDVAAVAEIGDQDGEPHGGFGRGDGEHHHGEHLALDVLQEGREGHQVDVDREQNEFDRHEDDDDVLAVHEDAEHADGEESGGDDQIVKERDHHQPSPCPGRTSLSSTPSERLRATWSAMFCFFTPGRWRSVSTMA